jgi:hypothetical protein
MAMWKKTITVILLVILSLVLILVIGIFFYGRDQAAKNACRCHVFEELLKPGMTRAEAERILNQYGEYRENLSSFTNRYRLYISYKDYQAYKCFGSDFVMEFSNDRYESAWLPYGVGDSKPVCVR